MGKVLRLGLNPDEGGEICVPCLLEWGMHNACDILVVIFLQEVGEGRYGRANTVMAVDGQ